MEGIETIANLEPLLKTFWFIAIPASLVFALQAIMTFIGTDSAERIEADFDGKIDGSDAPFQLFSLKNMANFLVGASWPAIILFAHVPNHFLLILLSIVTGILFVFLFFLFRRGINRPA